MNIILKYPIKYAPFPIYENKTLKAYIVCKCYLLESRLIYSANGNSKMQYVIVYYYDQYKNKITPQFVNETCINAHTINVLYDSLEQCRNYIRSLNNEIVLKEFINSSNIADMKNLYSNKDKFFSKYYELERKLLEENNIVSFNKYKRLKRKK